MLKAMGIAFDENAVKPNLKMASGRLAILINKKTVNIKANKREISKLLAIGKEEKARIRVEQIIREDFTIEAYEILELQCDLLAERMRLLVSEKQCPPDLEQSICTVIWAATRAEVPELDVVKKQFTKKYGVEFVRQAVANEAGCVNPRVVDKLSVLPPSGHLVHGYLVQIAKEYNVPWEPASGDYEDEEEGGGKAAAAAPTGYSVPVAAGSGMAAVYREDSTRARPVAPSGPPAAAAAASRYPGATGGAHPEPEYPPVAVARRVDWDEQDHGDDGRGGGSDHGSHHYHSNSKADALVHLPEPPQPAAAPPADNFHDLPPPYTPTVEDIPMAPSDVPTMRPQPSFTVHDIPLAPGSIGGPPPSEGGRRGSSTGGGGSGGGTGGGTGGGSAGGGGGSGGGGSAPPMPDSGNGNASLQPSVAPQPPQENAGPRRGSGESGMAGLAYDDLAARFSALRKVG